MDTLRPKAPCYQCPNREVGCHGKCEKYLAYRAQIDAANKWLEQQRVGTELAMDNIWKRRHKLKYSPDGKRVLSQR